MSFFNKLKQGVSDAGAKAKTMMEMNKLRQQVSNKQQDINTLYQKMGQHLYKQYEEQQLAIDEEIMASCADILRIDQEIAELEVEIRALNGEKKCVCGQVVPIETRFCSACGHQFPELPKPVEPSVEAGVVEQEPVPEEEEIKEVVATKEGVEIKDVEEMITEDMKAEEMPEVEIIEPQPIACPACNQPIKAGAKFCGHCGHAL